EIPPYSDPNSQQRGQARLVPRQLPARKATFPLSLRPILQQRGRGSCAVAPGAIASAQNLNALKMFAGRAQASASAHEEARRKKMARSGKKRGTSAQASRFTDRITSLPPDA